MNNTIDISKAQQDYESAKAALDKITGDITAPQDVRAEATKKREILIDNYIDQIKEDVEARTQQYVDFISELEGIIDTAGQDSPLEGVRRLRGIVDSAAQVVNSVRRDE